jgi:phosphoribosylaminoimidazolecarboxamide formyltransferase/IMP cyclohydrolase
LKALISVYDKSGVVEFGRKLTEAGFELVSTGGTYNTLAGEGSLPVQQVSEVTGSPEILEGRVKTLHPVIYGGLLARRDSPEHMDQLLEQGIGLIDLVAVNLYPFVATISQPGVTLADALENIDIGGPTMLRAAAKNFASVAVVVDPADYDWVAGKLASGGLSAEERRSLAAKAFSHVAVYDAAVAGYLAGPSAEPELPDNYPVGLTKMAALRYGENPHQPGGLYTVSGPASGGIAGARQLHGRELSFNNLMDADAAWRTVTDFDDLAVVVIKHANPCGLASHPDQAEAYRRAYSGDPVSAFGGIVGFNHTVTAASADAMSDIFYEVIVAPGYEPEALETLKKKRNLRVLAVRPSSQAPQGGTDYDLRPLSGGLLVQTKDTMAEDPSSWKSVTERAPTREEMKDLAFAWKAVKHVKSNAIVLAKDNTLLGIGAGQPNRVTSVHLALRAAGENSKGSVLGSDAFFPFADNVELAAQGGVTAIAQPGGSIRDEEVIAEANKHGIAMVFTGVRHFRH